MMGMSAVALGEDNTLTRYDGISTNIASQMVIGNTGTNNVLEIVNGAAVTNDSDVDIGRSSTAHDNYALIDGAATSWNVPSRISVGPSGYSNRLVVTNSASIAARTITIGSYGYGNRGLFHAGSQIDCDWLYVGQNGPASNNTLDIYGPGTRLNLDSIRSGYAGVLNRISIHGDVELAADMSLNAGLYQGADDNLIELIGPGLVLTNNHYFYVGDGGSRNRLYLEDVVSTGAVYLYVGQSASASNNVADFSANVDVSGVDFVRIGNESSGNLLHLHSGASLEFDDGQLRLGEHSSANRLIVEDSGTLLSSTPQGNIIDIGYHGSSNEMQVLSGAVVTNYGGINVGSEGPNNRLHVSGSNTRMFLGLPESSVSDDLTIGSGGDYNAMLVDSGAVVDVEYELNVGYSTGNELTLMNPGTRLWVGDFMNLGKSSNGHSNRIQVLDGARLEGDRSVSVTWGTSSGNAIIVEGAGSVVSNQSSIHIDNTAGGNFLLVSNGAHLTVSDFFVRGDNTHEDVEARVTGVGSIMQLSSALKLSTGDGALCRFDAGSSLAAQQIVVGDSSDSENILLFDGAGTRAEFTGTSVDSVHLGGLTDNQMVVSNGAQVVAPGIQIGIHNGASGNRLVVTGNGSRYWCTNSAALPRDVDYGFAIGRAGSQSGLIIRNGGSVRHAPDTDGSGDADSACIGAGGTAASCFAVVEGPGSTWEVADELYVGGRSSGNRLDILNGGSVFSRSMYIGRDYTVSSNTVTVSGTGSVLQVDSDLVTGSSGGGGGSRLQITNGASATVGNLDLYAADAGDNIVLVSGAGSKLSVTNSAALDGDVSDAVLRIEDGGGVVVTNHMTLKKGSRLTVSGTGTRFRSHGSTAITGASTLDSLRVHHGGRFECGNWMVGYNSTVNISAKATDPNTVLYAHDAITLSGTNTHVTVTNGARLAGMGTLSIGHDYGGISNRLTVAGSGTTWTNLGAVTVGRKLAASELTVADGARAECLNGIVIGQDVSAQNSRMTVDGSGTALTTDDLTVGYAGASASLDVSGGADLNAANLLIGALSDSTGSQARVMSGASLNLTGTLDIQHGSFELDGGTADIAAMNAAADSEGTAFKAGSAVVHSGSSETGSVITVGGADASASLTLGSPCQFSGSLVVGNQGTLFDEGALQAEPLEMDGGALEPAGTNAGTLTVSSMTLRDQSHIYIDVGSSSHDVIDVTGALTNDLYPTVVVHVRNLGGADWTQDRTIMTYGSVTGDVDWVVDLGDSGAEQLTVVHDSAYNAYVLKEPGVYYVSPDGSDTFPYDRWDRAAHSPQSAADLASLGDVIYVSNGVYSAGGRVADGGTVTNRLLLPSQVRMISMNGPAVTVLEGAADPSTTNGPAAVRGALLSNGSVLEGFTVRNGYTASTGDDLLDLDGGGILALGSSRIENCIVTGCSAFDDGGGIRGFSNTRVRNGAVYANRAGDDGGGIYGCAVELTSVAENTAGDSGGGLYGGQAENSIVYGNTSSGMTSNFFGSTFSISCTAPNPGGLGIITDDPLFRNAPSGDLRLSAWSPCINRGDNSRVFGTNDLDGAARIFSGTVDLGGYECRLPGVMVTNPAVETVVSYDDTTFLFQGVHNVNVTEPLIWTNEAAGITGSVSSGTDGAWQQDVPLVVGTNTVHFFGSNRAGDTTNTSAVVVRGGPGTGLPVIDIISPSQSVVTTAYSEVTATIGGTNNIHVFGQMCISNAANGEMLNFEADAAWTAPAVSLKVGANVITVSGTNLWDSRTSDQITIVRDEPREGGTNAVLYVAPYGLNIEPFASWRNAATNIQNAVDTAYAGDQILVTNGVYDTGGRPAPGAVLSNRVTVSLPVTIESVNGPDHTVIVGSSVDGLCGTGAVRGVYLSSNAVLSGFTISNGFTEVSGDLWLDRSGGGVFIDGEGTVTNCTLTSCEAEFVGGGTLCHEGGTVVDSVMEYNRADGGGGGCANTTGHFERVVSRYNESDVKGGGIYLFYGDVMLRNSLVHDNSAGDDGGGVFVHTEGRVVNCTIVQNTAVNEGGGVACVDGFSGFSLVNSILWNNSAAGGSNYNRSYGVTYTASAPLLSGTGCTDADPRFVDADAKDFRIRASALIDAADDSAGIGAEDLARTNRVIGLHVDMGAYEYLTPPSVSVTTTNSFVPYEQTHISLSGTVNEFQTGSVVYSNALNGAAGSILPDGVDWELLQTPLAVGTNEFVFTVTNAYGVSSTAEWSVERGLPPQTFVAMDGADIYPYDTWSNAAHTIQAAVDATSDGGEILVSNGTYSVGGRTADGRTLTNRVLLSRSLTLRSVNGPQETVIAGARDSAVYGPASVRCVWVGGGSSVIGFTLTNGCTDITGDWNHERGGGGALVFNGGTVSNCIVRGCSASKYGGGVNLFYGGELKNSIVKDNTSADAGGGVACISGGLLENTLITGNTATNSGGGIRSSGGQVIHATVAGNQAATAGGIDGDASTTHINCIVYGNSGGNHDGDPQFMHSCTWPLPTGDGNITNNPLLTAGFRLQTGSPCIDAGTNMLSGDLEGLWRPLDGGSLSGVISDMGCYETYNPDGDSDGDSMTDGWEQEHGLNYLQNDAAANPDGDLFDSGDEYIADTDPLNSNDWFRILSISNSPAASVQFVSSSNRLYTLMHSTNLTTGGWTAVPGAGPLIGTGGEDSLTDTNEVAETLFYRLHVERP